MIRSVIKEKMTNFITDYFIKKPGVVLNDDTLLLENGIIDSTGVIELVAFIEETFTTQIEDEEIIPENLNSLNKIVDFIQKKQRKQTHNHIE